MAVARRLGHRRKLPIVSFFHDWSSTWLPAPRWVKHLVDRQIRRLYCESRVSLPVSPTLRHRLGPHSAAWTLPPIPDEGSLPAPSCAAPFHIAYAGVFHLLYRAEIEALAVALHEANEATLFRVFGPRLPTYGPLAAGTPVAGRIYGGYLGRDELSAALAGASALLVVSPFAENWREIARFSFPSKIPEYCRFGKPILLWGPPDAASVEWANRTGAALVVSDPRPEAVVAAIHRLRDDTELRARLGAAAARCADTMFHPRRLQGLFESALLYSLGRAPRPPREEIE